MKFFSKTQFVLASIVFAFSLSPRTGFADDFNPAHELKMLKHFSSKEFENELAFLYKSDRAKTEKNLRAYFNNKLNDCHLALGSKLALKFLPEDHGKGCKLFFDEERDELAVNHFSEGYSCEFDENVSSDDHLKKIGQIQIWGVNPDAEDAQIESVVTMHVPDNKNGEPMADKRILNWVRYAGTSLESESFDTPAGVITVDRKPLPNDEILSAIPVDASGHMIEDPKKALRLLREKEGKGENDYAGTLTTADGKSIKLKCDGYHPALMAHLISQKTTLPQAVVKKETNSSKFQMLKNNAAEAISNNHSGLKAI